MVIKKEIENSDIYFLRLEINTLKDDLNFLKESFFQLENTLNYFKKQANNEIKSKKDTTTDIPIFSTTIPDFSTDTTLFKPLEVQFSGISTGNKGVSTDRQTDRHIDRHTNFELKNPSIDHAHELIDSLANIKQELRIKLKKLTNREMIVFSSIYQLEEEEQKVNYKILAKKLNLTESSIRDYVARLISKQIPIRKKKLNNKEVHLTISSNLKKIASLDTLLRLKNM